MFKNSLAIGYDKIFVTNPNPNLFNFSYISKQKKSSQRAKRHKNTDRTSFIHMFMARPYMGKRKFT